MDAKISATLALLPTRARTTSSSPPNAHAVCVRVPACTPAWHVRAPIQVRAIRHARDMLTHMLTHRDHESIGKCSGCRSSSIQNSFGDQCRIIPWVQAQALSPVAFRSNSESSCRSKAAVNPSVPAGCGLEFCSELLYDMNPLQPGHWFT